MEDVGDGPLSTEVGTPADELRRILDERLAKHHESTLRLLSQRNELAPISRLPNEVLGMIFDFACASSELNWPLSTRFNFSYVSRRWRLVALDTPKVWSSSIPLRHQGWAPVILERSKSADLRIDEDFMGESRHSPFVLLVKGVINERTPRIRELSFTGVSSDVLSHLLDDLEPASLQLHSLCLESSADKNLPSFPVQKLTNPNTLLNLDIERMDVDWFRLPLTNLVSLKVRSPVTRPSWSDFITSLEAMPALEKLYLHNCLPLASESHRKLKPVKLPNLQKLSLKSKTDLNEVFDVLSFIVVRQTTRVNLNGTVPEPGFPISEISFPNFTPSVSTFISQMTSETNETLCYETLEVCFGVRDFEALDVVAWTKAYEFGAYPIDCANFVLSVLPVDVSSIKILQDVLPVLPLTRLVSLIMNIDVSVERNFLVATFGNLPHLRNVTVGGDGTNNFLSALLHKPDDDYDTCASAYYSTSFPALHSVELRDVVFTPRILNRIFLEDCLMERWERKAEIRKLALSNCFSLYQFAVQRLREIVVDVDWDGLEQEYQMKDEDGYRDEDFDYTYDYTYTYDYSYTYD